MLNMFKSKSQNAITEIFGYLQNMNASKLHQKNIININNSIVFKFTTIKEIIKILVPHFR